MRAIALVLDAVVTFFVFFVPAVGRHAPRLRGPGATIPAATLCGLAHAWWDDRIAPDWVPHTREQNQAILGGLGLVGSFWQLP
jgi:hypothetical protein